LKIAALILAEKILCMRPSIKDVRSQRDCPLRTGQVLQMRMSEFFVFKTFVRTDKREGGLK